MATSDKITYHFMSVKALTSSEKSLVISTIKDVTNDAWCDFGNSYEVWLDLSDYLVIAKDGDVPVAFDLKGRSGIRDLTFVSSMVRKKYQNRGITSMASRINIKHHYRYLFRSGIVLALSILFRPIYFVFRTPNPRLYYSVQKFHPFPSIVRPRPSSAKEQDMARIFTSNLCPDCKFNEDTFVLEKALKNEGLFYSEDNYPRSKSTVINLYFENAINYKNNQGNLQVIVGRISLWDLIK